jgi:hypothetical protein
LGLKDISDFNKCGENSNEIEVVEKVYTCERVGRKRRQEEAGRGRKNDEEEEGVLIIYIYIYIV